MQRLFRLACLVLTLAWLAPSGAAAHGAPAAITGVAAVDAGGAPWLLRLTEGLAIRDAESFRFLCPAAFGRSSNTLLASAAVPGQAWVVGADAFFRVAADGALRSVSPGTLDPARVVQLVPFDGAVHALSFESGGGARIVRLADDGVQDFYSGPDGVSAMASGDGLLWLAAAEGDRLSVSTLDADGQRSGWGAVPLSTVDASLWLHVGVDGPLLRVQSSNERTLYALSPTEATLLRSTTDPLRGPVSGGSVTYVVEASALLAVGDGTLSALDAPPGLTGLGELGGRVFAFALGALYGLPAAPDEAPLLDLDGMRPPRALDDPDCSAQWTLLAGDLARAGYEVGEAHDDAGAEAERGGGCAVFSGPKRAPGSPTAISISIFVLAALWSRRRAKRGGRLYPAPLQLEPKG